MAVSNLRLRPDQQAKLDAIMGRPNPVSAVDFNTGQPVAPTSNADYAASEASRYDANNRSMDSHNRLVNVGRIASAVPLAFAAAPALAGGGVAAGAATAPPSFATEGIGFSSASGGTGGLLARLGSIFGSKGFETGTNAGLTLLGQRQTNKASDQARQDALANQTKMIELEQARLAAQLQTENLNREDARALNDAIQKLEQQKFALTQEQAQFERGIMEKEQAAKDTYRSTIQQPAANRLRSILGF